MTPHAVQTHVPEGISPAVYAAQEAADSFQQGRVKDGIASLNHALWIALTRPEQVSELQARQLYRRVERAAKVWEQ